MVLFVVSDAGPAKYIASLLECVDYEFVCLTSTVSYKVLKEEGINCVSSQSQIKFNNVNCVVTGTILGGGLEKDVIEIAKQLKIPTISIIEHWSLYTERFFIDGMLQLPDHILLNDEYARSKAIESGLPKENLVVLGNPFLEKISNIELNPNDKESWINDVGFKSSKVITFISEEIRNDFPKETDNYQGFDEFEVLEDLIKIAKDNKFGLLIRLHPSEPKDKYDSYLSEFVKLDNGDDYDSVIFNSDFIIGMGSMFLIEASMFRNNVISFRPNERVSFFGNEIGITKRSVSKDSLNLLLQENSNMRKFQLVSNSCMKINRFINEVSISFN